MTYTTIQGDTWDIIAYKLFGVESRMLQLMQANPDYISTVIFSAGVSLAVPDIPETAPADLPPWRQVTT